MLIPGWAAFGFRRFLFYEHATEASFADPWDELAERVGGIAEVVEGLKKFCTDGLPLSRSLAHHLERIVVELGNGGAPTAVQCNG